MAAGSFVWQRRRILAAGACIVLYAILGPIARASGSTNVLSIVYSGSVGLDPNVENLANNLAAAGATVTSVRGPFPGDLADLLQNNAFDRVYIWDLSIFAPDVNQADKTALSSWYANHANIVLDSRGGAIFRDNDASEQALCANIVANLANRGGGLWIGASYAPQGAQTANALLAALDPNDLTPDLFAGSYENISAVTGSQNPLLTTPNAVNAAALGFSFLGSFGRSAAPATGPGDVPLATVITDAEGHRLITTNIPEPVGFLGMGAGAALFASRRRGRRSVG